MDESNPCRLVRETCEFVIQNSEAVTIDPNAIHHFVDTVNNEMMDTLKPNVFNSDLHFVDEDDLESTIQYLLLVDTINFCFWPDPQLEYECIAGGLKKSVLADRSCLAAQNLKSMSGPQLRTLLQWPTELPLEQERVRLVREMSRNLIAYYDGQAANIVAKANNSAVTLVDLLTANFPGFRDHAIFQGKQVFYYKRAQIFVGDVWGALQGQGLGHFHDINELTMFPDYRVPQVLRCLGIIKYSTVLEKKVNDLEEIAPLSTEELEIRAACVHSVEVLKCALIRKSPSLECLNSVVLDWWLWEYGERRQHTMSPHHRTLTIYY